jgi:DNA-binding NarL/FixJ family response regulator
MTRIFIFSKPSLFSQGVESLLAGNQDMEIVGKASEPDEAVQQIQDLQPDVVLIVSRDASLKDSEDWKRLLSERISGSIIELNLQMNIASSYRIERQVVDQAEDLVKIIEQSKHTFPVEIFVDEKSAQAEGGGLPPDRG